HRKGENFVAQNTIEVRRERHDRNQAILDRLGEDIKNANLDVFIIIGDDQYEVFLPDHMPSFVIYNGEKVLSQATTKERLAAMHESVSIAHWARVPEADVLHQGAPELANHVISSMIADHFDISVSSKMPAGQFGENGVPHFIGFFYHRIMNDLKDQPNLATFPVFINTFFAPNQPTAQRVLDFGRSMGKAIRSWDKDLRVGIAASGGFSHFVIDEELDERLIKAVTERDEATLVNEPEYSYQSGTSEIKNWIATMGITEGTGLEFELIDYIPCYRSDAGTGNAMTFGLWK
ncbi:MAG: hypothetical protein QGF09_12585, partial [Rhodospirillales bacterium]|nr:hypothetical protein [Rhodospirillales bacterium]